ncbi:MAG: helicase, partial [Dehalococcoidia bacterium]
DVAIDQRGRKARTAITRIEQTLRKEIAALHDQLTESITTLGISPAAVERVVRTGLELGRQSGLAPAGKPGEFVVPRLTGSWARATSGLADPLDATQWRPITFDHAAAAGRDDVVLAHIGHRLVAHSMRLLRAEIWSTGPDRKLSRVSARMAKPGALTDLAVVAHARVVITGADGHRLHEEVITAGGTIRNDRFSPLNVGETKAALEAGTSAGAPGFVSDEIAARWEQVEARVFRALDLRAEVVASGLDKKLAARADEEERNVREVLTELQRSIRQQLADLEKEEGFQLFLSGFSLTELAATEREQVQRNLDALRSRVDEIPGEIEREVEVIRRRYASPQHRLFPAAVTFIVPESYARSLVR